MRVLLNGSAMLEPIKRVLREIFRSLGLGEDPREQDPGVRVPTKRGPSGPRSAIALAEPDDLQTVRAIGSTRQRR